MENMNKNIEREISYMLTIIITEEREYYTKEEINAGKAHVYHTCDNLTPEELIRLYIEDIRELFYEGIRHTKGGI